MKRKQLCILYLFINLILPVFLIYAEDFQDPEITELFNKIKNADFYSEKIAAGEKLGRLQTEEAHNALKLLMKDESYIIREAALHGLFFYKDQETTQFILNQYFTDFMNEFTIEKEILSSFSRYFPFLTGIYTTGDSDKRKKIIYLFGLAETPETEIFLKNIIQDDTSVERRAAYEALIYRDPAKHTLYIRTLTEDKELKYEAYTHLLQYGSKNDLPLFRKILTGDDTELYSYAYQAVEKWGLPEEAEKLFFDALNSKDSILIYSSLLSFSSTGSERIMKKLCVLTYEGEYQNIRILAGTRLADYNDQSIIPYLIHVRQEVYIPAKKDGWDIFWAHITFGLSALFDYISEKQQKKDFYTNQDIINTHLQKLTGKVYTSPGAWTEWGQYNGYTINGINLITLLFSPDPKVRSRALNAALLVMGTSERQFFSKHPELLILNDTEIAAELAKMLVDGHYIYPELNAPNPDQ